MKRTFSVFLVLAVVLFCVSADISFSGETAFDASISIPPVENPWGFTGATLKQTFELDTYGDTTDLYLNAGFTFNAVDCTVSPFVSELYADLFADKVSFRFGCQKATWGVAEILSAVDVLTPSDLSDPVSMEKSAINALKVSYDAFPLAFELFWIPVFTPAVLPPMMTAMYQMYGIEIKRPELSLKNGEVGARATAYTSAGDFALYGYYGWEDMPDMTGEYDRLVMAGASAAVPVGDVTLKAEAAWYPKRNAVFSVMAGLEWIKNDFTFIGELYGEWNKAEEKFSCQVGASISYTMLDGDLELSAGGILELRELDGAVMGGASYSFSDELKATAGIVYVFEGKEGPGTYGAFKSLSGVRLEATYSF
jgi:hypothetical protein